MPPIRILLLALLTASAAPAEGRRLTVVGINDTHGALMAAPAPRWLMSKAGPEVGGADWLGGYLSAIRQEAKEKGGAVLVLDGGDDFQGSLISNQFQGRSVTEVYNALGVGAQALGNHEFDFGVEVLKERVAQAKYPLLAANVFFKGTRRRPGWLRPSVLLDVEGIRVGIVGLATVSTPITTNPVNVADLEFVEGGPAAAEEADALRAKGATVVLICAHAGPRPPEQEIQRVAEAVQGKVDAIVSGHHHVAIGPPPLFVGKIPIVQSGAKLQAFSVIDLALDGEGRVLGAEVNEGALPKPGGPQAILHSWNGEPARWRGRPVQPDPRVTAILRKYDDQVRALREKPVGETLVDLWKDREGDLLGSLAVDALRSGAAGGLPARFALQNAGGLRVEEIPKGPITYGQIFDLYPFDNEQFVLSLPAEAVRNALEAVLRAGKGPMRVSGLRYVIDWDRFGAGGNPRKAPDGAIVVKMTDAESGQVLCETKACAAGGCESACAKGPYAVAVTDFLANGGDGLRLPAAAPRKTSGALARDMIVAFVREHRPLGAEAPGHREERRWMQVGSAQRGHAER
ncbi:MAG TPA: bifunctional UDP-sugar hydrolase/5'-nucleotidase [Myxococcales bacterium]|nr:bifunctional UDP-sugar hydrolase/5'-nucleotidase [Myxococcales bacterium]